MTTPASSDQPRNVLVPAYRLMPDETIIGLQRAADDIAAATQSTRSDDTSKFPAGLQVLRHTHAFPTPSSAR